jgi:nucleotide-binding universal stress UspA family protein
MFERILVPLDGSLRAERAVTIAARLARASGAEVTLTRVIRPVADSRSGSTDATPAAGSGTDGHAAVSYLERVAARDDLAGIPVATKVLTGSPVPAILGAVAALRADLLVLCNHGRGGLSWRAVGRVAAKIAELAPVPVLIVHSDAPLPGEIQPGVEVRLQRPLCALIALDGSAGAELAIQPAAHVLVALAAPHIAHLLLLGVVDMVGRHTADSTRLAGIESEDGGHSQMEEYLHRLALTLRNGTLEHLPLAISTQVVSRRDVAEAIVLAAAGALDPQHPEGCDLIAMAAISGDDPARWSVGSVTRRVLQSTSLPVLIVHPEKAGLARQPDLAAAEKR